MNCAGPSCSSTRPTERDIIPASFRAIERETRSLAMPMPAAAPPPPMPATAPPPMTPSPPVLGAGLSPPVSALAPPPMAPPATAPPAAVSLAMAPPSTPPPAPWLQAEPSPMASTLGAQMYSEHTPTARVPLLSSTGDLIPGGMAFHLEKINYAASSVNRVLECPENSDAVIFSPESVVHEKERLPRSTMQRKVSIADSMIPTDAIRFTHMPIQCLSTADIGYCATTGSIGDVDFRIHASRELSARNVTASLGEKAVGRRNQTISQMNMNHCPPHQFGGLADTGSVANQMSNNKVYTLGSSSVEMHPGYVRANSTIQAFQNCNPGGYWFPQQIQAINNGGCFLGYRQQPQFMWMQQNNVRQMLPVSPGLIGNSEHMMQVPMVNCARGGSFQELLRSVSSPNWGIQREQNKIVVNIYDEMEQEHDKLSGDNSHGIDACTTNGNIDVSDLEDENDGDGEEEYHDADDEDSDGAYEQNAGMQNMSSGTPHDKDSDSSFEYEVVTVTGHVAGQVKKRRRFPKGYIVPDFRPPREIGTIEKALERARTREIGTHIFEPKLGMVFDSRAEIYNFFNLYSWEVGFGIRFGRFGQNRVNKMRTMQEVVCEKEGFDTRCKNSSNRMRCKAKIRLHRTEDLGWYISQHVSEHNHPLSVTCGEKREWNSHGRIEDSTKRMIRSLRENNIAVSNVQCIMGTLFGRMEDVPFNQKSLKAVCSQISRDQKGNDISKTFEIFRKMHAEDPGFQFSVDLDEENKVRTLLWTSGRSRSQYNFFGDAITFDTTYCTNIYKMPFGMFVGVNNHFQSVLFAGVLMTKEDTVSFKWVFTEFITLMGGKFPQTILTDQCKAMTKAIKEVFADSTVHLWCKWHVLRYAPEELGPVYRRNGPFRRDFHYVINQMLTVDEFERAWQYLLEHYGLQENEFMKKTYAKRHKWAKPWCRDTFCARMATTQRSESANSILKRVVPRNSSMNRLVEQYNKMLFMRLRAEEKAEHQTKQFVHRTKRMYALEKHAITVYTKNCFQLFREEVDKSIEYDVGEGGEQNTYTVIHNNAETRQHWARVLFTVRVAEDRTKFSCECGNYEHFGMLCCHAIKVMIHCGIKKIPEAHIMKRWTRDARDYQYQDATCTTAGEQLGQTLLYADALELVNSTHKVPQAGEILRKYLKMARKEIDALANGCPDELQAPDGNTTAGYISSSSNETDALSDSGYDSDGEPIIKNNYGAAGSSAYMSDADVNRIKAPFVTTEIGRKREKRYKSVFERSRKRRKRYTGTPVIYEDHNTEGGLGEKCFSECVEELRKKNKKN